MRVLTLSKSNAGMFVSTGNSTLISSMPCFALVAARHCKRNIVSAIAVIVVQLHRVMVAQKVVTSLFQIFTEIYVCVSCAVRAMRCVLLLLYCAI